MFIPQLASLYYKQLYIYIIVDKLSVYDTIASIYNNNTFINYKIQFFFVLDLFQHSFHFHTHL